MIASLFPSMPADLIRSRDNALVRRLRALIRTGADGASGLLEGFKLLEEALSSGMAVEEAVLCPRAESHPRFSPLADALQRHGVRPRWVTDVILDSLSDADASQGVLAVVQRPRFEEAQLFRGNPLLLVAVGIQNPGNLGALLRTAEAAGASGAYLTQGCADPFSWKALRGAMGSAFRLPQVRELSAAEVLRRLQARGVSLLAAGSQGRCYTEVDLRGSVALLVGNEGSGLPEEIARAGTPVWIPMAAPVESLNVGVAAGILLFEAARQRRG